MSLRKPQYTDDLVHVTDVWGYPPQSATCDDCGRKDRPCLGVSRTKQERPDSVHCDYCVSMMVHHLVAMGGKIRDPDAFDLLPDEEEIQ